MRLLSGWPLVGVVGIALGSVFVGLVQAEGATKDVLRQLVRISAASSFILFILLFVSSAVEKFWPSGFSEWLRKNRRYLGLSFAVSHILHGIALASLLRFGTEYFLSIVRWDTIILGGLAYVVILLMVITSLAPALFADKAWVRPAFAVGMYYIWLIFVATFAERSLESPTYLPYLGITLGALVLRVVAAFRRDEAENTVQK